LDMRQRREFFVRRVGWKRVRRHEGSDTARSKRFTSSFWASFHAKAAHVEDAGFQPEGLGQHSPGRSPGFAVGLSCRLKAWDSALVAGLQPALNFVTPTQGVALGYAVRPLRGQN
jgi:hypothetical protein